MKSLLHIAIDIHPEAEDAVSELLLRLFGIAPSIYADFESGLTRAQLYLEKTSVWNAKSRAALKAGLEGIRGCGLELGSGEVAISKVKREDWAESWKRHFKPMEIGRALLIKPSWEKKKPKRGQALVILDPGLSFGTGQHATTSFCLEQLANFRCEGSKQSLLDVGCGSGILAIAGAKLGYSPVKAFDFDPEAVRVAKGNCATNDVAAQVKPTKADLTKLPAKSATKFDLICANLLYDLLLSDGQKLIARLKPDGRLVLAGILIIQFPKVLKQYEKWGLTLTSSRMEKEWMSGTFRFDS